MTTMEMLKLAEEVAEMHNVHAQFTALYHVNRLKHGILASVHQALTDLNLLETFHQYR